MKWVVLSLVVLGAVGLAACGHYHHPMYGAMMYDRYGHAYVTTPYGNEYVSHDYCCPYCYHTAPTYWVPAYAATYAAPAPQMRCPYCGSSLAPQTPAAPSTTTTSGTPQ